MSKHAPGYDLSMREHDATRTDTPATAPDAEGDLLAAAVAEYEEDEAKRNHDARQRAEAFELTVRGALLGHPRGLALLGALTFEPLYARALVTAAGETWAIGPEQDPPAQRFRIELLGHTGLDGYGSSRRFVEMGSLASVVLRLIGERAARQAANDATAKDWAWADSAPGGRATG